MTADHQAIERTAAISDPKRVVRDFYEKFSWQKNDSGQYRDTSLFVDSRRTTR